MDQLQTRLDALEQRTHTVERQLRWWRGLACSVVVLAVLTWALPAVIAQEEASHKGQKGLAHRVAALEKLLKHFSREGKEIFITGANLHIVNGLGRTNCGGGEFEEPIPDCPNGLGNLIVGYNELPEVCDPRRGCRPLESIRTGSHNVVVGRGHSFSRFGGIVVGFQNTISGDFASVSGGDGNTASGNGSSVSGGARNTASGELASVSGGSSNTANGFLAAVSGGQSNTASDLASSVSGGQGNTASGVHASVSGGDINIASGALAAINGGGANTASGIASSVSGGESNTASGDVSSVSGGVGNTAIGRHAVVSGGAGITQENNAGWSAGSEADEVVVGNFRSP